MAQNISVWNRREEYGHSWHMWKDENRNFKGSMLAVNEEALWDAMGRYGYGRMPKDLMEAVA